MLASRETKYSTAIMLQLEKLGHATNSEMLTALRSTYPDLSATTVHRATTRLHERGKIREAPADRQGAMRYDFNTAPHDHFICTNCGNLKDIDIAENFIPIISKALGGCKVTGRLVIHGSCENCLNKEKKK